MTADIELLPLDESYEYKPADMRRYARANVAHATAAQAAEIKTLRAERAVIAAKDAEIAGWKLAEKSEYDLRMEAEAEIERLRAEVEAVWAAMPRDARYLDPPDGGCVPLHEQVRRMAADATLAERLAEALRSIAASAEEATTGEGHAECASIARAALDQETTNG